MMLWLVLFVLVLAISFVLAIQSMRDFQEMPSQAEYGLFLVRQPHALSSQILDDIKKYLKSGLVISFERLFKGNKSTLVVFIPRAISARFGSVLGLLELEDYSRVDSAEISAWEVGVKKGSQEIFKSLPQFLENEQFWWQVTLSSSFQPQIRAVVVSAQPKNKDNLADTLQRLSPYLVKLPKAYSNETLLEFYQQRSFKKEAKNPALSAGEILRLIMI